MGHIPFLLFVYSRGHVDLAMIQVIHEKLLSSDLDQMIAQKARLSTPQNAKQTKIHFIATLRHPYFCRFRAFLQNKPCISPLCSNDKVVVYHICLNNFTFKDMPISIFGKMVDKAFSYHSFALAVYHIGNTSIIIYLLFKL